MSLLFAFIQHALLLQQPKSSTNMFGFSPCPLPTTSSTAISLGSFIVGFIVGTIVTILSYRIYLVRCSTSARPMSRMQRFIAGIDSNRGDYNDDDESGSAGYCTPSSRSGSLGSLSPDGESPEIVVPRTRDSRSQ